jgi:hypothetical protein
MSRDYKNLIQDHYYHVYNRGHHFQNVFEDDQDYFNFLKRLKILLGLEPVVRGRHRKGNLSLRSLPPGSFDIIAYCLMSNHYHLLIRQNTDLPISNLMNRLCSSYGKYFNAKYGLVGSVFQDTFKAKVILPDNYLAYLTAYIHNNPTSPASYPYSSFQEYITGTKRLVSGEAIVLKMFGNDRQEYEKFVNDNRKG